MKMECGICPHRCALDEGETGFCKARVNLNGKIICKNYGLISSVALDPIEKKPLKNFMPNSKILSVGSFGCNLRCPFCQNYTISMADGTGMKLYSISKEELVEEAVLLREKGNVGIAYTYNEPLIGFEFVYDCAVLAREAGLKNIVVTNGYICEEPFLKLLPFIDAMNIDLKGFTEGFYKKVNGDLKTVKNSIRIAAKNCHVEITTLIIPGENDSEEEMDKLSKWISEIREDIPLHITKFYPQYKYLDKETTSVSKISNLAKVARKHLKFVYMGNC